MKGTLIAGIVATLPLAAFSGASITDTPHTTVKQPLLGYRDVKLVTVDGLTFKDLNGDGQLNPYEDWRLPAQIRTADLLARMTLDEKVGVMMHGSAPTPDSVIGDGLRYDLPAAKKLITERHVNSFITRLTAEDPAVMAEENNKLQHIAENTRLGIPITLSSDPRNTIEPSASHNAGAGKFSQWPETLGLAAIGDESLTRRYANIIRQEYRAVGITQALSPQADLATEPRWPRISGTFGEEPLNVKRMVRGYITGMQNGRDGLNPQSVIAVVKHWLGYGAAEEGWDSHNAYGKYALFHGESWKQHAEPFTGAFEVNVAAVMPTYSILRGATWRGKPLEPVGAGFNAFLLNDLLRQRYGFNGVVLSDWLITDDCDDECLHGFPKGKEPVPAGMPWGVEDLSIAGRFIKAVKAGVDQFGGVTDAAPLMIAVQQGKLHEEEINQSVQRILLQKFQVGLFEQPYVDSQQDTRILGNPVWQHEADGAQTRSLVLLQNKGLLPLKRGSKIWLHGAEKKVAVAAGFVVVDSPDRADVALIRSNTPFELLHPNFFFGLRHHEGSLAFSDDNPDYRAVLRASAKVPTLLVLYLDRPAILTNILPKTQAVVAHFGVSDRVLFNALAANRPFTGRLPFELPSGMEAVRHQRGDLPHDSANPLFPLGYGLSR